MNAAAATPIVALAMIGAIVRRVADRRTAARRARNAARRLDAGFTLLELMAAIAVVSILASIALPSYIDYIRRSRLTDAFQTMSAFRTRMEQAFQDNGNYGVGGGPCAVATPATTVNFVYACALGANGASFSMSATGIGLTIGYAYSVDDAGNQRTTAFPRATVPVACWLTRPGIC